MINRDFSRSGKEYIKQNKIVLIVLAVIALIGVVVMGIWGFNGGAEMKGYYTFNITMGVELDADKVTDYAKDIKLELGGAGADMYTAQLAGEGDQALLVVKYMNKVNNQAEVNEEIAKTLGISADKISAHSWVEPSVDSTDYIYTIAGALIIVTLFAVYVGIRYNLACAITSAGASLLSVLLLLSLTSIFRLVIDSSFLFVNIATILLVLAQGLSLFDGLEKERANLKDKNDRTTQLQNTLKRGDFNKKMLFGALFIITLLFVFIAPTAIKYTALTLLFAIVVAMFVSVYALPFLWSLTITQVSDKIRAKKDKKVKVANTKSQSVEGELENRYTENQVIEVKEDNGEESPSQDDNITIEE